MNFRLKDSFYFIAVKDSFYFIAVQPHDANVTISMGINKKITSSLTSSCPLIILTFLRGRKGERS